MWESVIAAADVEFLSSVDLIVATPSELRSLLPEVQIPELSAMAKARSRQGIWGNYFAGKRTE